MNIVSKKGLYKNLIKYCVSNSIDVNGIVPTSFVMGGKGDAKDKGRARFEEYLRIASVTSENCFGLTLPEHGAEEGEESGEEGEEEGEEEEGGEGVEGERGEEAKPSVNMTPGEAASESRSEQTNVAQNDRRPARHACPQYAKRPARNDRQHTRRLCRAARLAPE